MFNPRHIGGSLDDVRQTAPGGGHRHADVVPNLPGLRLGVPGAHHIAVGILRHHSGNVHGAARLHHGGKAGRRRVGNPGGVHINGVGHRKASFACPATACQGTMERMNDGRRMMMPPPLRRSLYSTGYSAGATIRGIRRRRPSSGRRGAADGAGWPETPSARPAHTAPSAR